MAKKIYRQKTTAGGVFDGTDPGTTPADGGADDGIIDYPAAATGGLFPATDGVQWLESFTFHAAAAVAWSLVSVLTDPQSLTTSLVLFSGTADTDFVSGPDERFCLPKGSILKLVAAAPSTSGKMTAMVILNDRLID